MQQKDKQIGWICSPRSRSWFPITNYYILPVSCLRKLSTISVQHHHQTGCFCMLPFVIHIKVYEINEIAKGTNLITVVAHCTKMVCTGKYSPRSLRCSSSQPTVFSSHTTPAAASGHQPANSVFLSHYSISSLQHQHSEHGDFG